MSTVAKIRTLGFYQPFGTLMLHGKIETRWVREGRNPPFPLGKYLFYTTQKSCDDATLLEWCGEEIMMSIVKEVLNDETRTLSGYAIAVGDLWKTEQLKKPEEAKSFVKFIGNKTFETKEGWDAKTQWGLHFENVKRIEPFKWNFGKQGVGFVPESELNKIKITP